MRFPLTILALASASIVLAADPPTEPAADFLARDLRENGIEPTIAAVRTYLESIRPTNGRNQRILRFVAELGHDDFHVRERATRELIRTPKLPRELIESATDPDDAEVRIRLRRIFSQSNTESHRSRIMAALRFLTRERPPGFTEILLDLIPEWRDDYLSELFDEALTAVAAETDEPNLRRLLEDRDAEGAVRTASLLALERLLGDDVADLLEAHRDDANDRLRLTIATRLLNRGRREALVTIDGVLDSKSSSARRRAVAVLRRLSGERFGYSDHAAEGDRRPARLRWQTWVTAAAADDRPLRLPISARMPVEVGRTLVSLYAERKLKEIDDRGRTLWEIGGFTYLWGCQGLPNGHRLACDYNGRFIVEFDRTGKQCWRHESLPGNPSNVERLDDGRTLVALSEPGMLLEVTGDHSITWMLEIAGRPTTTQRLEGDRTLVCLQKGNRVVEIDRTGKVMWQVQNLGAPQTAQRLDNGNTLVAELTRRRVVEFNPAGEIVWKVENLKSPAQAQRLANGHTMVSDSGGITVFDLDGQAVRRLPMSRVRFSHY